MSKKDKTIGRSAAPPYVGFKVDWDVSFGDLVEVKTSNKKESVETLRHNFKTWLTNPLVQKLRKEKLDIGIIAKVSKYRMKGQDVDNIAKIVLDALKKRKGDDYYLFEDDSQIIRLYVYKVEKTENERYDTAGLGLYVRKHNPSEQILIFQHPP